jgi:hypothetical protein
MVLHGYPERELNTQQIILKVQMTELIEKNPCLYMYITDSNNRLYYLPILSSNGTTFHLT